MDYELRQREQAATLARQGRLAEAALSWEILTVLRPEIPEYREQLARSRRQIETTAAERLQRATQAQKKGDLDQAAQYYLAVLALQPDHAQAAEALRSMERERNKRQVLGKPSRFTLMQRSQMTPAAPAASSPASPGSTDRNELEHAVMLTVQREFDGAISLLERRVAANRNDDVARSLLADAYYQKGEDLATGDKDPAGATRALEKAVRLDPAHPLAAQRLKQLKATAQAVAAAAPASTPAPSPAAGKDVRRTGTGRRADAGPSKP